MTRIGYARVSTLDQHVDTQIDALRNAGVGIVYSENVTGTKASRPEFDKALDTLRPGDEFVCTRLDRLGRSVRNLLEVVERIEQAGATLVVLDSAIDTSSPQGRFFLHSLAAVAEFERALISARTRESLVGRPRGRNGGRPVALSPRALARCQQLYDEGSMSLIEIARSAGVSKSTLCRHLTLTKRPVAG